MSMEEPSPQPKPILQKPPGYRDPNSQPPPPPPRKLVLPPSFRPKPKRRSCCRICCCACCIIVLILILVVVIAAGLFYLVYDPSLPEFHLGSFRVPKLNVTDGGDGSYLDADTSARVEVKNRSGKMTWRFSQSRLAVSAENGDLSLGSTNVAGFAVKEKGVAELKAETSVRKQALDDRQRRKLKGAIQSKALVPTVEVRTKTGVGLRGWNSPSLAVTVVCGDVTMRQLEKGDPPLCSITLLKCDDSGGGDDNNDGGGGDNVDSDGCGGAMVMVVVVPTAVVVVVLVVIMVVPVVMVVVKSVVVVTMPMVVAVALVVVVVAVTMVMAMKLVVVRAMSVVVVVVATVMVMAVAMVVVVAAVVVVVVTVAVEMAAVVVVAVTVVVTMAVVVVARNVIVKYNDVYFFFKTKFTNPFFLVLKMNVKVS
ncbi:hypothetical protein E2542_SST11142 [Spatholobus suberectus]|nr:hypothetical protein E2542_SST11142 [Spatholobus suberectus]